MPSAESTADKLTMTGKPVNITNIEEKVKEGFSNVKGSLDDVADRVKSGEYNKVGDRVKSTSRSFFDALGNVILFFFKIMAKFIGIILMIVGASTLIALVIGLLSAGVADIFHFPGINFADAVYSSTLPIWVVSLLVLATVGIPFFFIFILGLKILVNNLKPLSKIVNISLLGIWLASVITLAIFAAKEVQDYTREASVTAKTELNIAANDTLYVSMAGHDVYTRSLYRDYDFDVVTDENDNNIIYASNVRLIFRPTRDSLAYVSVEKNARGSNYQSAKERAGAIEYDFDYDQNELVLDGYFLTDSDNKFRDQEVEVTVFLPEGSIVKADDNTYSFHRNSSHYRDILDNGFEDHYLLINDQDVICLDCPKGKKYRVNVNIGDDDSTYKLDEDGLEIRDDDLKIKVDSEGFSGEDEDVKVKIDSSGINIKSKDN
jgi:hypothetical protein